MAKSLDVDLSLSQNQLLLNPQLPFVEKAQLEELAQSAFRQLDLREHTALATSGSTRKAQSSAKLVFLSKSALLASASAVNAHLQVTSQDSWASVLPTFHVGGLGIYLRAALADLPVFSYELEKWSASSFHEFLISSRSTLTSLVPTQVYDLVSSRLVSPRTLRAVIVGGGRLSDELWVRARHLGWPLLPSFGMSETCSQIATATLDDLKSDVLPLPQLLSHAQLTETSEGVLLSSSSLLTAYAQVQSGEFIFWDPKDSSGYFLLEDQLRIVGDRIEVLGRESDFIKISGESLNLSFLRSIFEGVLTRLHLDIHDFVLMQEPDERLGHRMVMVTTNADEILHQKIKDLYRAQVLAVAKIRETYVVPEIPRSPLGKVLWGKIKLGDRNEK